MIKVLYFYSMLFWALLQKRVLGTFTKVLYKSVCILYNELWIGIWSETEWRERSFFERTVF
jgi:hypothetical protein